MPPLPKSPFEPRRIEAETFIAHVEHYGELPSTNDLAIELAAQAGLPRPLLVLADRQTRGRGRGANAWWASPGALTFSVLLKAGSLRVDAERRPQIALAAGLSVCEALQTLLPTRDIRLKWPNDVYVDWRKVCGVLVESAGDRLIVGVGVNVNNSFAEAPPELQGRAGSLFDLSGETFDLQNVLIDILQRLENDLESLASRRNELAERWRSRCLLTGRIVRLTAGRSEIVGRCRGIDSSGALVLQTGAGRRHCHSGVVSDIQ